MTPERCATVVERLVAAGAILIGKTNLDQFATGLVGVRTPYPVPRNACDPALVPGGSSSGSGVAVARGMVTFALGTDTAGSGRVPAALNNIVGLKPSRGALSARGVVPACRTLDCVSVFAGTSEDAWRVMQVAAVTRCRRPMVARIDLGAPWCRRWCALPFRIATAAFSTAATPRPPSTPRWRFCPATPAEVDLWPFFDGADSFTKAPGWPSDMPRSATSSRRSRTRSIR